MTTLNLPVIGLTDRTQRNQTNANFQAVAKAINGNAVQVSAHDSKLAKLETDKATRQELNQAAAKSHQEIQDVEKRLTTQIADNLSAMNHKAERIAVGSDLATFFTMLNQALEDPQIRDTIHSIAKE